MSAMQRRNKRDHEGGHSLRLRGVTRQMVWRSCRQKVIEGLEGARMGNAAGKHRVGLLGVSWSQGCAVFRQAGYRK